MKKIQYFILSISLGIFAGCDIGFSQSSTYYADLIADYSIINKQSSADGYRLNNTLTRAELAKIASNLGGMNNKGCSGKIFIDVQSTLGDLCGYTETLADAKVVATSSKYYRPNDTVTRAEAIKILLGVIGEGKSDIKSGYLDVNNLGDLEGYINKAKEIGSIANIKYIYPNTPILRYEVFILTAFYAGIDTSNPAFAINEDSQLLSEILFGDSTVKTATSTTTKSNTGYIYLKNGEKYEFAVPKVTGKYAFGRIWYDNNYLEYANNNPDEAEFIGRCDEIKEIQMNYSQAPITMYEGFSKYEPCSAWDKGGWFKVNDTYYNYSCSIEVDDTHEHSWMESRLIGMVTISDSERKVCGQIWLKQEGY